MKVNYINKPMHPVSVLVIGAGGNGSEMIKQLSRINYALRKLNHPGMHVTLADADRVEQPNVGRQLFSEAHIGQYKSNILITNANRFFSTAWKSLPERIMYQSQLHGYNLVISCVDNVHTRIDIERGLKSGGCNSKRHERLFHYWMDLGNSKSIGQVLLQTNSSTYDVNKDPHKALNTISSRLAKMKKTETTDDTPSCSTAEALAKQDLMINTFVTDYGAQLLWEMFTQEEVDWCGIFINLKTKHNAIIKA